MCRIVLSPILGLLALAAPAALHAAAPARNATGTANLLLPRAVTKLDDMDFGFVTVTTAGTAILNSSTDAITATGGVLFAGGSPHAARFRVLSPSKTVVHVRLPSRAVTLTRAGGTETMSVDTWTMNGAATRNVVAKQAFEFKVGGTLRVGANQVEGVYTGTFAVTVDYN
jgi:hypothetical protein